MRLTNVLLSSVSVVLALSAAPVPGMPEVVNIVGDTPAQGPKETVEERGTSENSNRWVTHVSQATMTIYRPPAALANGTAVLICPGGGYGGLAIDKEGHNIARWLNTIGVTGVVLKYRMPQLEVTGAGEPLPVDDAQSAMQMLRANAKAWGIDPARIGIMGFSAGGHLASTIAVSPRAADEKAASDERHVSARPDFVVLGYPVISMSAPVTHAGSRTNLIGANADGKRQEQFSSELLVTAKTPPAFLFHAKDDKAVPIANSEMFAEACQKAGVPVELHEFDKGGHGFGFGSGDSTAWPGMLETWLKGRGLLERRP